MTCKNWHATGQDRHCPYCIVKILTLALEQRDPFAPELTPAMDLLHQAEREIARDRKATNAVP